MLEFLFLHIRVSSDNCFLCIPACFDTVTLICEFGLLFENLNLVNNFQQWVLHEEFSNCRMWAFLYCYRDICPCDLDHLWNGYNRGWWGWFFSFFLFVFLCLFTNVYTSCGCLLSVWLSFKTRVDHFCSLSLSVSLCLSIQIPPVLLHTYTHRIVKSMVREKLLDDMSQLTKVYLFIFVVRKLIND